MIIEFCSPGFRHGAGETTLGQPTGRRTSNLPSGGYQAMPSLFVLLTRLFTIGFDLSSRRNGP
jgi:hypothetical protein